MPRHWKPLLASALALFVLAGCGGQSLADGAQKAGAAETSSSTTTTAPADPYAIPANIDAAYVSRVLNALMVVRGDVRRQVYSTHSFPNTIRDELGDIYDGKLLDFQRGVFSNESMEDHTDVKPNPGVEIRILNSVRSATASCITVEDMNDGRNIYVDPHPATGPWVTVLWSFPGNHGSNPTPWKIEYDDLKGQLGSDYSC